MSYFFVTHAFSKQLYAHHSLLNRMILINEPQDMDQCLAMSTGSIIAINFTGMGIGPTKASFLLDSTQILQRGHENGQS